MIGPVYVRNAVDTWTDQSRSTKVIKQTARINLRTSGGANAYGWLFFTLPFPRGSKIVSAKLRMVNAEAQSGSHTLTVRRPDAKWSVNTIKYGTQPGVTGATGSLAKTGAAANTTWEVDIAALMQEVSSGAPWYGLRITTGASAVEKWYSSESSIPEYRPVLIVEWSEDPDEPDDLSPGDGLAVSVQFPTLTYDYSDPTGEGDQVAQQIQFAATEAALLADTPAWDSGEVATTEPLYVSNSGSWPGVSIAQTVWWRVRAKDSQGTWSVWSDPTSFIRTAKGVLALVPTDNYAWAGTVNDSNSTLTSSVQAARTNKAFNPRSISTGYLGEMLARSSWTRSFITGQTGPVADITTAARYTNVTEDANVTGRGEDIYGSASAVAPLPTTGDWVKQPVTAGQTITISKYVRSSVASTWRMSTKFHDGVGNWVDAQQFGSSVAATANEWVRVFRTVVVPAGATHLTARLDNGVAATFPDGATIDTTGLLIEVSGTLGTYFDGATPDNTDITEGSPVFSWTWSGTTPKQYRLFLYKSDALEDDIYSSGLQPWATSHNIPFGVVDDPNALYTLVIRGYDDVDRVASTNDPIYVEVREDLAVIFSPLVASVTGLAMSSDPLLPLATLKWDHPGAPQEFQVLRSRDGGTTWRYVDEMDEDEAATGGSPEYKYDDDGAPSYDSVQWRVVAVIGGVQSQVALVSGTIRRLAPTLYRRGGLSPVSFMNAQVAMGFSDVHGIHDTLSGASVLVTQRLGKRRGSVSGRIIEENGFGVTAKQMLNRFLDMRDDVGENLFFARGDETFKVNAFNFSYTILTDRTGPTYEASFEWIEVD